MTRRHAVLTLATLPACTRKGENMNAYAERYVKLILAIGQHDPNYVDSYYGPAEWKVAQQQPLQQLETLAADLLVDIDALAGQEIGRQTYLSTQTRAALARIRLLRGQKLPFHDEAKALYGVAPPRTSTQTLDPALAQINKLLPGGGSIAARATAFEARYFVPAGKVDAVFRAAIAEARARTRKHCPDLPANESFDVEYVKGKSWSAYNWYKGNAHSVIQVNIDLPIGVDRILHLACHEGYPGHHVYNGLLEAALVRGRQWVEYSVYPLYSPQSLIAEGTADYGASLAFSDDERLQFLQAVLFPAAGLAPGSAPALLEYLAVRRKLRHARIEAARGYLDGPADAAQTVAFLEKYALMSRGTAERSLRFFDEHRSYVMNYSYGEDLVAAWVDRNTIGQPEQRWPMFLSLLNSPRTPANLL